MAEPSRRRPDGRPLRAVLTAMDEISEYALMLAAAVHDGARAPGTALAPYRITLDNSFHEICSCLQSGAWLAPALPCDETPAASGHDRALATVAAETASVLAALEQLEQTWHVSA